MSTSNEVPARHAHLYLVITDDARLSVRAKAMIETPGNVRFFSMASAWEIAIKTSSGKLNLGESLDSLIPAQLAKNMMQWPPIDFSHVPKTASLPLHHRDPFDRLLIAQAIVESIPLLSIDPQLDAYGVDRRW